MIFKQVLSSSEYSQHFDEENSELVIRFKRTAFKDLVLSDKIRLVDVEFVFEKEG